MSERRTPEEVHADGGHDGRTVGSCSLCHAAEPDTQPDEAPPEARTTEAAPEPLRTTEAPAAAPTVHTRDGCGVCGREVYWRGLCAAHYQTRRGSTEKEHSRG